MRGELTEVIHCILLRGLRAPFDARGDTAQPAAQGVLAPCRSQEPDAHGLLQGAKPLLRYGCAGTLDPRSGKRGWHARRGTKFEKMYRLCLAIFHAFLLMLGSGLTEFLDR